MRTLILLILSMTAMTSMIGSTRLKSNPITAPEKSVDPRTAMIDALSALAPHPSLGAEAHVFDRFIGTWDCDYTRHLDDGSTKHAKGELEFGWILDGRAIQDIWISYPNEPGKERSIGTTVRFFDIRSKLWRVIFVNPAYGALMDMKGGQEGGQIILRGTDDEGAMLRWSFNDITAEKFTWRGEKSRDGGKTWKLEEEHYMTRRTRPSSIESVVSQNDPRLDMIRVLRSDVPNHEIGSAAEAFNRFVGTWDLDCTFYAADGTTSRLVGEWRFGWALDGRIEQDVIVEDHGTERIARGTTLRFYDPKLSKWRIVWIAPPSGNVAKLNGGVIGNRILLDGVDADGSPYRWSFNDIHSNSFVWRGESSTDGGKTWRLGQEMHLTRGSS